MGRLAESFGLMQAMKYRGRIKDELEKVLAVDPSWQADPLTTPWAVYATVPLFGGSSQKRAAPAERVQPEPNNMSALVPRRNAAQSGTNRRGRLYLQRVIDGAFDDEWAPENREFNAKAAALLKQIRK